MSVRAVGGGVGGRLRSRCLRDGRAIAEQPHQRRDRARPQDFALEAHVYAQRRERRSRLLLHLGASRLEQRYERRPAARRHDLLLVFRLHDRDPGQRRCRGALRVRRATREQPDQRLNGARSRELRCVRAVIHSRNLLERCRRKFLDLGVAFFDTLDQLIDQLRQRLSRLYILSSDLLASAFARVFLSQLLCLRH